MSDVTAPGAFARTEGWEIVGERGRRLHARLWEPAEPEPGRPPVVLVHGFGEHVGRYDHLAGSLAGAGRAVWAMDLRGHGRSEGSRADVERLDWALSDLDVLVAQAAGAGAGGGGREQPRRPAMFGHSMGGSFAAAYAITRGENLSALVLSAPALHLALRPWWQALAAQALAGVVPRAPVGRIDPETLSHDPDAVNRFTQDPLVWHGKVPARTAVQMYKAGRLTFAHAAELRLPVLVVHGECDPIVPLDSSRRFLAAIGSSDKQLVVVPGAFHEPHHEIGKERVIADIVTWLARH